MNDGKAEYTFLWFIVNFDCCWHKTGDRLLSPCFTAKELEGKSWFILVHPRGIKDAEKGYISLLIGRRESDEGPDIVSLNCELSVFTNGLCLRSSESKFDFRKGCGRGWPYFVRIENVPHGTLTVRARIWKGEGEARRFAPVCAQTRIVVENVSFLQVVENFSTLEPNQKKTIEIRSHSEKEFVVSSSLLLNDEGEMIVDITSSDGNHILCRRNISLLDVSGNVIPCGESDNRSDSDRKDTLTKQVILNKKSEYLPDDKLSLFCECTFSVRQEFDEIEQYQHGTLTTAVKQASNLTPSKNEKNAMEKAYPSVSEDMKALYMNQRLTDVELETKTKSFPAHKSVLCARSPVFDAMMTNDMKEKNTNRIQVDDLGDDIVQQMLLFLYSDEIENLQWNSALELYYAGDKYQIGKLKQVCSSFLVGNLTIANAGELLVLADDHSDSGLKKTVEEFILGHEKEVFGSKEWEMLMKTNPLLALTAMHLKYKG